MMAELLCHGMGVKQDKENSKRLFQEAANSGYVAAFLGLISTSKLEKKHVGAIFYFFRALFAVVKLTIKDKNDPRLMGIGGQRGTLRRDWVNELKGAAQTTVSSEN